MEKSPEENSSKERDQDTQADNTDDLEQKAIAYGIDPYILETGQQMLDEAIYGTGEPPQSPATEHPVDSSGRHDPAPGARPPEEPNEQSSDR